MTQHYLPLQTVFSQHNPADRYRQTVLSQHSPADRYRQTVFSQHSSADRYRQTVFSQHSPADRYRQTVFSQHSPADRYRKLCSHSPALLTATDRLCSYSTTLRNLARSHECLDTSLNDRTKVHPISQSLSLRVSCTLSRVSVVCSSALQTLARRASHRQLRTARPRNAPCCFKWLRGSSPVPAQTCFGPAQMAGSRLTLPCATSVRWFLLTVCYLNVMSARNVIVL